MMNLKETMEAVDTSCVETPSCKRPRHTDHVVRRLQMTPPPVPGEQTVLQLTC